MKKTKMPKFENKNTFLRYFWAKLLKNYSHIGKRHPQISQIAKFCEITKIPKFGTKNALFRYFRGGTLKSYCHI